MSDKTISVMRKHLDIAEKFLKNLRKAQTKNEMMGCFISCREAVKDQYPELEEIADDFCTRITEKDAELSEISRRVGDIFGTEITKLYGKMGKYMADQDFLEAQAQFDIVIGNNPLFGVNQFGGDVAAEVSKTIAGSIDGMATMMMAESTETSEDKMAQIVSLMQEFHDLSERYVARMITSDTASKISAATDAYVTAVKKLIPKMNTHKDELKLINARKEKPAKLTELSEGMRQILGVQLRDAMQNRQELLSDKKVQKSVQKLSTLLTQIPY
jgi:ATP-dependent DNA ligase